MLFLEFWRSGCLPAVPFNRLPDMLNCLFFKVGQVMNVSSMLLDYWEHLFFGRALKVPFAVISNVFAMEDLFL